MNTLLGNIPSWINRHRKWVLGAYVLVLIAAFAGAGKLQFDDSLESWFEQGSPVISNKHKFESYFGSNEDLYLVYQAKDGNVFSEASLAALDKLQRQLESYTEVVTENPDSPLTHIREVRSLMNESVTDVHGDDLIIHPFIGNQLPESDAERDQLRTSALANPDFKLKFVSPNGEYGGISIKTNFGMYRAPEVEADLDALLLEISFADDELAVTDVTETMPQSQVRDYTEYTRFMDAMREQVEQAGVGDQIHVYYTGLPELISFQVKLQQEMGSIFLGLFVLIFLLSLVIFRHFSAPVWTLAAIIVTLILTMGTIGFTGMAMSSLSQAMIMLIILISVADVIHIMASYRHQRSLGHDHESSMSLAYSKAAFSCFLTTFTTVVGFSSLWLVKPSVPVANFGIMSAIGLAMAFLVAITLLPVMLDTWKLKVKVSATKKTSGSGLYQAIFNLTHSYPRAVLAVLAIAIGATGAGAVFLKVDTNNLEAFDKSTEIRQAFEVADRNMGGTQNIDLMLEFGQVDAVYDGDILRRVAEVQDYMHQTYPELIVTSTSIVNVLKQINQQLHQNNPEFYSLPESDGEISQLLFLFNNASPEDRKKLISENFDATRISFGLRNAGSSDYVTIVEGARKVGDRFFGDIKQQYPGFNIANTGGLVAFVTLFDKVTESQILSFLVTLGVIMATLVLVFRSVRLGLLAMVPSLVPVVVTFGTMGWLGVSLDNVTMVIAPIILGIAVDDSIHFIRKLQVVKAGTKTTGEALEKVLNEVGSALVFTSVILAGGLLTMMLSSNASFQHFGYLSAIAIFSALLADLLMIPSICTLAEKRQSSLPVAAVPEAA